MTNKLLCIVGPTGTGKTALGLKIAEKFRGEVVSCDSRQVYRGMDIVTGKDIPENSKYQIPNSKQKIFIKTQIIKKSKNRIKPVSFKGIPVWGVDLVEPDEEFTAAHWVQYAYVVIKDIWNRQKTPVIVGGTGFWLRSLLGKIDTLGVSPDDKLRRRLAHKKPEELFIILTKLDCKRAEKMNRSDRMNPRRLIRAIEIARQVKSEKFPPKAGLPLAEKVKSYNDKLQIMPKNILIIGLTGDIALLEKRIQKRVTDRLKEGAMDETKRLLKKGYQSGLPGMTACGYRVLTEATKKNWPEKELALRWFQSERGYLKRQQTWFHKEKGIRWFNIGRNGWEGEVVQKVKNWYDN